MDRAVGV